MKGDNDDLSGAKRKRIVHHAVEQGNIIQ
jgi:hypothetical protein